MFLPLVGCVCVSGIKYKLTVLKPPVPRMTHDPWTVDRYNVSFNSLSTDVNIQLDVPISYYQCHIPYLQSSVLLAFSFS